MKQQLTAKDRILARGEHSNHCHVITGDVTITVNRNLTATIEVGEDSNAVLRHLLEKEYLQGTEIWTGEHKDITLRPGVYTLIHQQEIDPITRLVRQVRD